MAIDAYRVMALLNAAIYDATVAAWDAKYAYNRPRPAVADAVAEHRDPDARQPVLPCEHAVAAGAAATVLAYVFPDEAGALRRPGDGGGRLPGRWPGSPTRATPPPGWSSAERSGSSSWPTPRPTARTPSSTRRRCRRGPGIWSGDPATLAGPTLGTWKTWVLDVGRPVPPGPPPAPDSPERAAELAEVKNYPRDAHPFTELWFWPQDPAGRPAPDSVPFSSNQVVFYYAPVLHFLWGPELAQKLFEYRWDANPPRAARAYALVSIAGYDATVACWDAKFHYWTARPDQFDPEITTVLPTYPIPDYPSGHATALGGHGRGAGLPLPARRAVLPVAGRRERRLARLGRHPLPQRLRGRAAARPRRRPGRDRLGRGRRRGLTHGRSRVGAGDPKRRMQRRLPPWQPPLPLQPRGGDRAVFQDGAGASRIVIRFPISRDVGTIRETREQYDADDVSNRRRWRVAAASPTGRSCEARRGRRSSRLTNPRRLSTIGASPRRPDAGAGLPARGARRRARGARPARAPRRRSGHRQDDAGPRSGREAAARGARVLTGACYDLTNTPPYGPWLDLFDACRARSRPAAAPGRLRRRRAGSASPTRPPSSPRSATFFAALAAARPALVLLEDLHWADPASLELLRHLAPRLRHWPILLLVTYRGDELTRRHPFALQLPALVREADGLRLDLRRLDAAALRALVAARYRLPAADEARLVAYLDQHAEGNPLFATELLRALRGGGAAPAGGRRLDARRARPRRASRPSCGR